jgi:hypothetical protein
MDLKKALEAIGAQHPFEIVVAPEDEEALRKYFSQWPSTEVPIDALTRQADIVIRVRQ